MYDDNIRPDGRAELTDIIAEDDLDGDEDNREQLHRQHT
jgi:hypothetical protein